MFKSLLQTGHPAVDGNGQIRVILLDPVDARIIEGGISRFSFGLRPLSQALRAWTMKVSQPASRYLLDEGLQELVESCSSMPIRVFTVTGMSTTSRIALTQSATSAGSPMRQAPKRPFCTRSEGQPTLRLTSSYPRSSASLAQRARSAGLLPPSCRARVFLLAVTQIVALAVDDGARGHHLGIEQGLAGHQTVEITAMPSVQSSMGAMEKRCACIKIIRVGQTRGGILSQRETAPENEFCRRALGPCDSIRLIDRVSA